MNRRLCLVLLIFIGVSASAQVCGGKVVDRSTKVDIAFASIIEIKGSQRWTQICDVNGHFELRHLVDRIIVSAVGYKTDTIDLTHNRNKKIEIELVSNDQNLKQLEVSPLNNPALRIIRKVLENKKSNDFENYQQYAYRAYNRTALDYIKTKKIDDFSLEVVKQKQSNRTPFISESVVLTKKNNQKAESKIIAQHTAGVKNPFFAQTFASTFHQTISFYKNSISLFEVPMSETALTESEYISPLSDNCLSIYRFDLENTIVTPTDTLFEISYFPRSIYRSEGLKGRLYISSHQYAVKSVVAEPFASSKIIFRFKEEFSFVGGRWFPVLLEEEIGMKLKRRKSLDNIYPTYIVHVSLDSIRYQLSDSEKQIHPDRVYFDPKYRKDNDSLLNVVRSVPLEHRDSSAYNRLDSLGQAKNFDKYVALIPKLSMGRLPIGVLDIDFAELIKTNKYEGNRPTLGLYTNEALSGLISIGGFARYGELDQKFKYGTSLLLDIYRKYDVQFGLSYQHNLKEFGMNMKDNRTSLIAGDFLRDFLGYRFDDCVQKQLDFGFRLTRGLKIMTKLDMRDITSLYAYHYRDQALGTFHADEMGVEARYAFGESYSTYAKVRVINYSGNPIVFIRYNRGVAWFRPDSYVYNKLEIGLQARKLFAKTGQTSVCVKAGYIDRDLPASLMFSGEGSYYNSIMVQVANTFQTMNPYEFLSDKYVNMFLTHNFGNLILNSAQFKPRFSISHNTGWGNLRHPENHDIEFRTKNKIYLESGLKIDDIVKVNVMDMFYLNLGIGGFYRWGAYQNKSFSDNCAIKLALRISTK